jgi:hypothetical protein
MLSFCEIRPSRFSKRSSDFIGIYTHFVPMHPWFVDSPGLHGFSFTSTGSYVFSGISFVTWLDGFMQRMLALKCSSICLWRLRLLFQLAL